MRAAVVSTRPADASRALSPASTSRDVACPAIESSTIAVTTLSRKSVAKRFAPTPPNSPPSVATKKSVCAGLTMLAPGGAFPETELAYERASSISAAIPEALSFAPAPVPTSSR